MVLVDPEHASLARGFIEVEGVIYLPSPLVWRVQLGSSRGNANATKGPVP